MEPEPARSPPPSPTQALLVRWSQGDRGALDELVKLHLDWLTARVEQELGAKLRERASVADVVQQALLEFLKYAPRFVVQGEQQLRGLLARIVRNVLADQHDFYNAKRRARARERPLGSESMISLDPPRDVQSSPSHAAQRDEEEAWVRLGIELLDPESRNVLVLREWEHRPFAEIGAQLRIAESAARMRHHRAVLRLASVVVKLKSGQVEAALEASRAGDEDDLAPLPR